MAFNVCPGPMTSEPTVNLSHEIEHPDAAVVHSHSLKFHQLQYLIAIAERGSLRLAAQSRGVSFAAISKGLHELEKAVGMPLFERRTQGAVLTSAGQALLLRARAIVNEVQGALTELSQMRASVETKLSVGVTPWIAQSLLAPTVSRFFAARPDVSLNLVETFGTDYSALREGSLNIAIGLAPENVPSDLISRPLFSYEHVVVCRQGHPLQGARSLDSLHGQSWVLSHGIEQYQSPLREFFAAADGAPNSLDKGRLHSSRSTLIALQMIENSDLLCVMPYPLLEAVRDRFRVDALSLKEALPVNTTSYLTRRNTPVGGAIAQFIAALIESVETDCQIQNRLLRRVFHSFERVHKT